VAILTNFLNIDETYSVINGDVFGHIVVSSMV